MDQGRLQHYLNSLKQDLLFYSDSIFEISSEVINSEISSHPIFIAHMGKFGMGELILDKEELGTNWSIQVSTLEEFSKVGIVEKDKVQEFKASYKDPKKEMCVFLFTKEGASFVYFPYKTQSSNASSD